MENPETIDIAIIGGGIAGLAAAIRLKKRYEKVVIFEKNAVPGGKLDAFEWQNYRWDKGPSLFTEPELVDELFVLWQKNPRDYFNYVRLEDSCSYYFSDGTHVTLSENEARNRANISKIAGNSGVQEVVNYKQRSAKLFNAVGDYFISNPKPKANTLLGREMLKRYKYLIKKEVRKPLNTLNQKHFTDPRLVQLFNRFGTYNGSNPYQMSGLYSTIAHVELNKGAFFPLGGMRSIVDALIRLAKDVGVEIRCNTQVTANERKDGTFTLDGAVRIHAQKLVCAIDHLQFYKHVLQNDRLVQKWKNAERSTSGLIFYWAIDTIVPELNVHNILFSEDYQKEFDTLFRAKELVENPTFYIHLSSKVVSEHAPNRGQNWFVMINTPAGVIPNLSYRNRMKKQLCDRINTLFNVDIAPHIQHEDFWDCHAIQQHSGSHLGALYGPASNSLLSAIKKHGNQSTESRNMFFCGGTVHPGGGIPLVLRSAKIVSNLVT